MSRASPIDASPLFQAESDRKCGWRRPWHRNPLSLSLDEPTTYLDVTHQLRVLDLVRSLNQEQGITVIAVMHDLTQAARYCDRCAILKNGQLTLEGPPDALSARAIEANFDIEAWITTDPQDKLPVIQPRRPLKEAR